MTKVMTYIAFLIAYIVYIISFIHVEFFSFNKIRKYVNYK